MAGGLKQGCLAAASLVGDDGFAWQTACSNAGCAVDKRYIFDSCWRNMGKRSVPFWLIVSCASCTVESSCLAVASRTVTWLLMEQMRVLLVPAFHRLHRPLRASAAVGCCARNAGTKAPPQPARSSTRPARRCARGSPRPGMSPARSSVSVLWVCSACWAWAATRRRGQCCTGFARPWCGLIGSACMAWSRWMRRTLRSLIGKRQSPGKTARTTPTQCRCKVLIAIAAEMLQPKGFGRTRLQRINGDSDAGVVPFVKVNIEPGSPIRTDRSNAFDNGMQSSAWRPGFWSRCHSTPMQTLTSVGLV